MSEQRFSLKDHLFNKQKVEKIAHEINSVYPQFNIIEFVAQTCAPFPELELKQRISWISKTLQDFLPEDYRKATAFLLKSLPPPNDNTKTDNDFGDFIYAPYAEFVARYGCTKEYLHISLKALKEITMRFSVEDAIRYFINAFPDETMAELQKWTQDVHYHVRRLASEGTRPKLPWSPKITINPEQALPILDNLFADKTRYVTRSVANHLNDISKIYPELALGTLKKWKDSAKQHPKEMEYITKHALRTLIKQGYAGAIAFLDFSTDPEVILSHFIIKSNPVNIGAAVEFQFTLTAEKDEQLILDYILHFATKTGKGISKKVFKIKTLSMRAGETITIAKKHPLRRNMTTRTLHPGKHTIEIQINGKKLAQKSFDLID